MSLAKCGIGPLICLVCFLSLSQGQLAFAAEGNHSHVKQSSGVTTWCIVKPSTSATEVENIINFCCTQPSVDCSVIQPGGACYLPPNRLSDASVVMNLYYITQSQVPNSCNFQGYGLKITMNPSVGNCIYPA